MTENVEPTAENLEVQKTDILNKIFDMLVETTGIHGNSEARYREFHRNEFLAIQLRDEKFASEYWFSADASDNMKLLFDTWRGFSVITQDRTAKGIAAAEKANVRLKEFGYQA